MRQKDKKRRKNYTDRLKNIRLPDLDVLDDTRESAEYKTARTAEKSHHKYKIGMKLVRGRVVEVMSNYQCRVLVDGERLLASVGGRLKQFLYESSGLMAVGDYVELDTAPAPDYRIENVLPRKNSLKRYTGGGFQKEILLAANLDQLVITSSWRMPMFKAGLIDRYLIMAALHKISPLIVVNKTDLCEDFDELEQSVAYYRESGFKVILSSTVTGEGMDELRSELKGKDSVFSGHSGAGKSSLINYLEPGLELLTQEVSDFNEKGRHTTTQAILLPWSFGGHLVDTPGIKTINLHREDADHVPKLFPGFDRWYPYCRFRDCRHMAEQDCAVIDAMESGSLDPLRYESYLWIMENL